MGVWLSRRRKRIWRWDEEVVRPLSWRLLLLKRRPYSIVDRVGSSRVETSMYVLLFVNLQGRDSGQPVLLLQESLTSKVDALGWKSVESRYGMLRCTRCDTPNQATEHGKTQEAK